MPAMLQIRVRRSSAGTRIDEWIDAGFNRATASPWRQVGWEPVDAAAWHAASPNDRPRELRRLLDDGYSADQVAHVGRQVRGHVAAWTAATVGPAAGGPSDGAGRAAAALFVLDQLALDLDLDVRGPATSPRDVVLDLRDPAA
jgi:hypothetical protein